MIDGKRGPLPAPTANEYRIASRVVRDVEVREFLGDIGSKELFALLRDQANRLDEAEAKRAEEVRLAKIFRKAQRVEYRGTGAAPWDSLTESSQAGIISGVRAVLAEIERAASEGA